MVVALWFATGPTEQGEIRCGFDLNAGRGEIPSSLLRAVKTRVDPVNPIFALLRVIAGDWREVRHRNVSYVIELGSFASTTFAEVPATLQ